MIQRRVPPPLVNPFTSKYLPPLSDLLSWRSKLDNAMKIASNNFYIETDTTYMDLETVKHFIKLHEIKK